MFNPLQAEKNPGILRFGSLSVKVKKTTEAFNNYFSGKSDSDAFDSGDAMRMPPPKFAPIKKRKSKRGPVDFGKVKSAPTTPTKEDVGAFAAAVAAHGGSQKSVNGAASDESDSEFGFDSGWGGGGAEPRPVMS